MPTAAGLLTQTRLTNCAVPRATPTRRRSRSRSAPTRWGYAGTRAWAPMTAEKRYRVGMDSGGTFTDIVVLDLRERHWRLYKILSQHHNPAAVLLGALAKASEGVGLDVAAFVEETEMLVIGTTVAMNTLLQHRGAKVGFLGTRGHTDAIEIREGHKEDGHRYDWDYPQAPMLVPRALRMPITERVLADGSVHTPIAIS